MRKFSQREKILLLIALVLAALVPFAWKTPFAPILNSQTRHMRQVRSYIAQITPQWDTFRRQNPGFEMVTLGAWTGRDGMFGAFGMVPSEEHLKRLKAFMESTMPPRPVYIAVQVVGQEAIDDLKDRYGSKPSGSTNRSRLVGK
jgi:hypothetical protein